VRAHKFRAAAPAVCNSGTSWNASRWSGRHAATASRSAASTEDRMGWPPTLRAHALCRRDREHYHGVWSATGPDGHAVPETPGWRRGSRVGWRSVRVRRCDRTAGFGRTRWSRGGAEFATEATAYCRTVFKDLLSRGVLVECRRAERSLIARHVFHPAASVQCRAQRFR